MEIEDNYLDHEIFDMNPVQLEIYSTSTNHHHHYTTNNDQTMNPINYSWEYSSCYGTAQKSLSTINPPSSSSSLSSSATKLISFENSNTLLNIVTPPNCDVLDDDELAKGYYYTSNYLNTSPVINFSSSSSGKVVGDDDDDYAAKEILSHKIENNKNNNDKVCTSSGRTTLQARDHVVAERKRRENLSQLFVNLSQVVPGLKKLDKASVLEDAIKHLKELQERVRSLEEEVSITNLIVDTSRDDDRNNCCPNGDIINLAENNRACSQSAAAEIKARTSDKHVLIKIHCKKQKGLMSRVPCQLEKMHLSVVDMRILPFGAQPRLDITLLAEMRSEFRGTAKDIVDHMQRLFDNPC